MSRHLSLPLLIAITVAGCARELPTTPRLGMEPLFAKWYGQSAALNGGLEAAQFRVNNGSRDITRIRLTEVGEYTAAINLENTHSSATAECKTVGDAAVALSLKPKLVDGLGSRTNFFADVNLSAIGASDSFHEIAVFWVDGIYSYYLTIGQTNPSDATFPNRFPTVTQNGSTYTYSGGIVTLRVNYGKPPRNASLVCPNLDVIHMTYPAP